MNLFLEKVYKNEKYNVNHTKIISMIYHIILEKKQFYYWIQVSIIDIFQLIVIIEKFFLKNKQRGRSLYRQWQ